MREEGSTSIHTFNAKILLRRVLVKPVKHIHNEHQKWYHFKGQCSLFLLVVYGIFPSRSVAFTYLKNNVFHQTNHLYQQRQKQLVVSDKEKIHFQMNKIPALQILSLLPRTL